jgi:hypothetical protein
VAALSVFASCAQGQSSQVAKGTISGGIVLIAGTTSPEELRAARDPGTVIVRQQQRVVATQTMKRGEGFSVRIPAGSYQVTGSAPGFTCGGYVRLVPVPSPGVGFTPTNAVTVVIRARHVTTVEVNCESKLPIG